VAIPTSYQSYAEAGLLQKKFLDSNVKEAYKYWQELIGNSYEYRDWSFTARYIAGDYWVIFSRIEEVPVGARILQVEGEDVHGYVVGSGGDEAIFFLRDNLRENVYALQLSLPRKEQVKITYEVGDLRKQVVRCS
jgi:hypothetical protein